MTENVFLISHPSLTNTLVSKLNVIFCFTQVILVYLLVINTNRPDDHCVRRVD